MALAQQFMEQCKGNIQIQGIKLRDNFIQNFHLGKYLSDIQFEIQFYSDV